MTKINFVTSFNEDILKNVGHHFLKSVSEQWEPSLQLTCFTHDCSLESYSLPKTKANLQKCGECDFPHRDISFLGLKQSLSRKVKYLSFLGNVLPETKAT